MIDTGSDDSSILKLSNIVNISVGAVVQKDGKFLMIKEKDGWNFPSGKVSIGETPLEAVVRETLEETGVNAMPSGIVSFYYYRTKGNSYDKKSDRITLRINFSCDLVSENQVLKAEPDIQNSWLNRAQIEKIESEHGFRNWIAGSLAKEALSGKNHPLGVLFVK